MGTKNEKPEVFEFDVEEVVLAVEGIAKAMRKLNASRLKREAIVVLIQSRSKLPKRTIEIVLNNLQDLDADWLKNNSTNI